MSSILRLGGIFLGWSAFAGSHLYMSHPPNRKQLISVLGSKEKFLGVYSAVSFITFIPTTLLYIKARRSGFTGGQIWQENILTKLLGGGIKALGLISLGQAISAPQLYKPTPEDQPRIELPTDKSKKHIEPVGIQRISRHPLFLGFALLGVGNILTRGALVDIAYWTGFPALWYVGSIHQDMRYKEEGLIPSEYFNKTSVLPFEAVVEGKQDLNTAWKEMRKDNIAVALWSAVWWL
ncbi:hypothetical protein BKA69DRAFT_387045 [Paraphysoderma sedebokerense]|nr:hypothetical protein BKA69DRAFT_387045 [Paraphysoderma sedebokerense]